MQIKNKKILILGGSGFIGLNAVNYFARYNKITATYFKKKQKNSKNIRWYYSDLTKINQVKKIITPKYDIVIQCAGVTAGSIIMTSKPLIFITNNVIMNSNIIRVVGENNTKNFIFLSCTVMYHNSSKLLSEKNYDPRKKIIKNYEGIAMTKVYIENMCKFFSKYSATKFTAIRHSNIYGPYDKFNSDKSHFMANLITKIYSKKTLEIWGAGSEKRDFLFIEDLLEGINLIIKNQKEKFKLFNMSYGKSFSIKQIVNIFLKTTKLKRKVIFDKTKPTTKINIAVSSKKISNEIGWKAKTNIKDGIKKTIEWYLLNYIK